MIYLDQSQSETENLIQIRITFDTRFESALIFSLIGIDDRNIKWYILSSCTAHKFMTTIHFYPWHFKVLLSLYMVLQVSVWYFVCGGHTLPK